MAGTYEWVDGLLWQSYLAPKVPPRIRQETLIGFAPFTARCPNGFAPDRPNGYGLPGRWAGVLRKEEVVSTDRLVVQTRAFWRGAPAAVRAVVGTAADDVLFSCIVYIRFIPWCIILRKIGSAFIFKLMHTCCQFHGFRSCHMILRCK